MPIPSFTQAYAQLRACVDPYVFSAQTILEAGGGSLSHLAVPASAEITVIDISPEQLERHETARHKILGDLHTVDFGRAAFDVAVLWNVAEHLQDPMLVLDKLHAAIRRGGIIILAGPHPGSLQSLITRWTPHWAHVFILRHVFKSKTAGLPGFPPFEVVHHSDIAPETLRAWAGEQGLEVLFYIEYESTRRGHLRERSPLISVLWGLTIATGNIFSRSRLEASDFFFVVKEPLK